MSPSLKEVQIVFLYDAKVDLSRRADFYTTIYDSFYREQGSLVTKQIVYDSNDTHDLLRGLTAVLGYLSEEYRQICHLIVLTDEPLDKPTLDDLHIWAERHSSMSLWLVAPKPQGPRSETQYFDHEFTIDTCADLPAHIIERSRLMNMY